MCSIQRLRALVDERLSAAAEEICCGASSARSPELHKPQDQPQQQQDERCEPDWTSALEQDHEEPEKNPEELPSKEEDQPVSFVFTGPHFKNELNHQSPGGGGGGGGDPPQSTSAEPAETKAEDGSVGSPSDNSGSDGTSKWKTKKKKGPRLQTALKLHVLPQPR
ncbi:unnamed protein product [Pleuronectes platessa]|uniref:Uncharacterized protein n=1 Tax=Pleuronectes platessa TaxID=8262 RepID=A0A9N7THZ8_PLEPL|nr:unnamed protein product [Pleuronectes platessa]